MNSIDKYIVLSQTNLMVCVFVCVYVRGATI